jgi:hypothetical protein
MLFADNKKFILDEEDLGQLTAVFPDFMNKGKVLRINYNENIVQKIETNNPKSPFVFSKPLHSILLVNTWIDDETGEQREIRFSKQAPRYRGDGSAYFPEKHIVIDNSFSFNPTKDKELLWFCYNFSNLFSNGVVGNSLSPYKFLVEQADAAAKTSDIIAESNAKITLAQMSLEKLKQIAENKIMVSPDDTKEMVLAKFYSAMDGNKQFKSWIINGVAKIQDNTEALTLVEQASALGILRANEDGTQTIMDYNGKESIVADIPFEDKNALASYVSKEKKLFATLKKALA